jgi:hypothetical protein
MSRLRVAAAAAALVLMSSPAFACRTTGVSGVKGVVVDSTMSVQNGKGCFFRQFTTSADAVGNRRFPTTNLAITSRPSRGSASIEGNRITYRAPAGATGSDQFVYRAITPKGATYNYRVLVTIY